MRQVPAQFTDIITSLQGGQAPLTVLLQQGGQLKDTFGGIGPAAKALGGYVLGLVNPFTLAAGAAGALAYAYSLGSKEADGYYKALVLTGNASGTTAGQLQQMAKNIDAVIGTQASAADALTAFAAAGDVQAKNLERFATLALKLEKATGQSVAETVKQFSELGKDPVAASEKLNSSMNYLTGTVLQQIKALEGQGQAMKAANLAQTVFADTIEDRTGKITANLGSIETAWNGIKDAIGDTIDALKNIGRAKLPEVELSATRKNIAYLEGQVASRLSRNSATGDLTGQLAAAKALEATLSATVTSSAALAKADGERTAQTKARREFDKDSAKYLSDQVKMTKEIERARTTGLAANASPKEIADRVAAIRAEYAKKGPQPRDTTRADASARANLDIADLKARAAELTSTYSNTERVLEAQRSAGLVSESAYYDQKKKLLAETTAAQVDALNAENERLAQQKLNTADGLNRDRQVLENGQRIARLMADAATGQKVLDTEATKALNQYAASILSAKQAAQDYYDTTERQQQRELAGYGQGQARRNFDSGVSQIEDRYSSQKRDLQNSRAILEMEGRFTAEARKQYEERFGIIETFQAMSIESFRKHYAQRQGLEATTGKGQSEAIADYMEMSRNAASQTASMWSNGLSAAEDAWVRFATTGKLSMKDLVNSVLAGFARMQARKGISGLLSALIPGAGASASSSSSGWSAGSYDSLFSFAKGGVMSSAGALPLSKYASGGVASSPQLALFGEGRQAEAFVPLPDGRRIPVAMEGGGGTNVYLTQHIDARGADAGVEQRIRAMKPEIVREALAAVQGQANRGGSFARSVGRR
ncbi:phage tail length tape measure family protein [Pseudorhodoferax soli]|nr:phage tail length tape measure family protein [Pseudorhodoferax soli]